MYILKRNGEKKEFDFFKIENALKKAFNSEHQLAPAELLEKIHGHFNKYKDVNSLFTVEGVQDFIVKTLMKEGYYDIAEKYIIYKYKHSENRVIRERVKYIRKYANSKENAAANSNTDANANSSIKNVSSLEAEVWKDKNREIQIMFMKDELKKLYDDSLAEQYEKDKNNNIIYAHDEASSPVPKAYCGAYSTYPIIAEGEGALDGITDAPANDIWSFNGQIVNAIFSLSSLTKGAVALGDYFVSLNWCIIKDFGENWTDIVDETLGSEKMIYKTSLRKMLVKGFRHIIYGVNQPQGNRSYQSPFTNFSFYDRFYFESLFKGYFYPDGETKPTFEQIDFLQRLFFETMRKIREKVVVTFPVMTIACLYDEFGYKDMQTAKWCASEWSKGSSHFLYHSDSADSLSSCCRLKNKITKNTFTSTTGNIGLMTGSCNVITLNINRIVQDWASSTKTLKAYSDGTKEENSVNYSLLVSQWSLDPTNLKHSLKEYLKPILERVYKYHIAYKNILYDLEDAGMITYSKANMLYINKLYSTIGVLGYYEAAKFLHLKDHSNAYNDFLSFILNTIDEYNNENSIRKGKRPVIFNTECIPGESLAAKFYSRDKKDGYFVPENQNIYNNQFFNPWEETSVFDKIKSHGGEVNNASSGGQACHINLKEHLTEEQYFMLMNTARKENTQYITFNIPFTSCTECGHITNVPVLQCPKCGSDALKYHTRVVGFITSVDSWSPERQQAFKELMFGDIKGRELSIKNLFKE